MLPLRDPLHQQSANSTESQPDPGSGSDPLTIELVRLLDSSVAARLPTLPPSGSAGRIPKGGTSGGTRARSRAMEQRPQPSLRNLAGIALILLLIMIWAAFVASLARTIGAWPVLSQAAFYLIMGVAWIIPLRPLVRWMQTSSVRSARRRD